MFKTKHFYTICIALNHFAFGISSNVIWSALVDLSYIYKTSSETITFAGTFASAGYLIGSLSGYLYKWLNRQLFLSLMVTCIAVTVAFMPHYNFLALFFTFLTFNGIGGGSWDSSNNIWLIEMWPKHNGPIMQFTQFMYGLGTIVGPILVSPYVHGDPDNSTETANTTDITPEERIKELTLPFAVTGTIQIIVPVILFTLYLTKFRFNSRGSFQTYEVSNDPDEVQLAISPTPRETVVSRRKLKLILAALFLATYDGAEIGYFYYSPTMLQYMDIKLTASVAAHVSSVLSAAYTSGRLLTAFISLKLKPDIIVSYHFVIILVAQVVLFIGRDNQTIIYIATAILGYGFSAMWPAILAFTERHLKLSDRDGSIMFVFAGFVSIFTPFIIGSYLESQPLVLFVFEGVYLSLSLVLFIIFKIVI